MTQVELQSVAADAEPEPNVRRGFVVRLIVSSVSSVAGMISFALTGPAIGRVAAIDPALEAFYLTLVAGWFWSLARMWSLTFLARNPRCQTPTRTETTKKGVSPWNQA